jgi:Dual specificity phosphatase, catalytic domain
LFETTVHWVKGIEPNRLGLMARPRGGEWLGEEVAAWKAASLVAVVSLLESREVRELELREEAALCAKNGIKFLNFPIVDRGTPSSGKELSVMVAELRDILERGNAVAVHCRAGIGRTGVVAACLLHSLRVPYGDIFHMLSRSRGVAMPDTSAQADWVKNYTEAFPNAL